MYKRQSLGFWNNIARLFVVPVEPEQRGSLENPATPLDSANLGAVFFMSKSGAKVDIPAIVSLPAFWRAVKIISGVIASLPVSVLESMPGGVNKANTSHPVYNVLNSPSPLYSKYKFLETLTAHLLLYGNFYAIIRFDIEANPKELEIIPDPTKVTYGFTDRGALVYKLQEEAGKVRRIAADRMLHISNLSLDGIAGLDMPLIHKDNYGLAIANRDYGNVFYANGAHLSGALRHPAKLTQDAYNRLRSSWDSRHGGGENAGKTAILEEGMDYIRIGLAPGDAQFGETKKLSVADIALITGVPRFLLEESDPTFNNGETLTRLFFNYTIMPICENIEGEISRKLFKTSEMDRFSVRFDLNQLLRADTEQRGRYIDNLMKWGILNRNEVREMEGWNPIEDGSGGKFFVPLNMVDPTDAGEAESDSDNENEEENEQ